MAADLHIHVLEGTTEDAVKQFDSHTIGSKYYRHPMVRNFNDLFDEISKTPSVWVGQVSWLKAAILEDNMRYVPTTVMLVSDAVGEDFAAIDDALIEKVSAAFDHRNMTGYRIAVRKEVLDFLALHKGKKAFTISW